jgi:ProP effector
MAFRYTATLRSLLPSAHDRSSHDQIATTISKDFAEAATRRVPGHRRVSALGNWHRKQLLEDRPETDRKHLRAALGMHTHSSPYLKAMLMATQRFDLKGIAVGEVSEEQRALASKELLERFKKQAEEHHARKAARELAEKQERMEKEKLQKLEQLMSKFSRT